MTLAGLTPDLKAIPVATEYGLFRELQPVLTLPPLIASVVCKLGQSEEIVVLLLPPIQSPALLQPQPIPLEPPDRLLIIAVQVVGF